ncbi:BatA and WFA domain-containing protein [Gaetbulibacter jejuensis]|uniref:BatA and WFA domain-containing protein n=1 Tax=Gaetbulibacter jejuensis TaxID=584607 RepID=A0ABN1JTH8_9FLAO
MQFKHPELLYALLLLIIPIIVHLFQLRRFKKVEFTNVLFLKNITLQTRKSSQLKKWLTLLTRLLLLACAIIAFAQPYISKSSSYKTKSETVIYLDNSFSMQAKGSNGTLLNSAIQDIIEHIDENEKITFFTNNSYKPNTTVKAIKNELIQLSNSPNQITYDAALLKGKNAFSKDKSTLKNLVLISDFQQHNNVFNTATDSSIQLKLVQLKPVNNYNVAIDSAYISKANAENIELSVTIKNSGNPIDNLPVSLYNDDNLVAKSSISSTENDSVVFTLPFNQMFNGKLSIEDAGLTYDNTLFFNLDKSETIKVLSINEADDTFLKKIYTDDEFSYTSYKLNELDYNTISSQNLIVLNEIKNIPNSLTTALKAFTDDGRTLLIIPSSNSELSSYNQLFINYNISTFNTTTPEEKRITSIQFSHPLLTNVFDKKISNFQYPKTNKRYVFSGPSGASVLNFEDSTPFLSQNENLYTFTAALNEDNSNFKNSPLIVPVLYNIGKQSLKLSQLYYTIGKENKIDINTKLQQDDILKLGNENNASIPLQQTFTNKVELITNEYPEKAGIIPVMNKNEVLKQLSFNYNRTESNLYYHDLENIEGLNVTKSVASAINDIKSATNVNELWKWFVIFALAFLIIEMLILKYFK